MRSLTVRGAPPLLVALTVMLGACTANSTSNDAAAGDRDTTESTPTQTSEPGADEVMELPPGRDSAAMPQGRYELRLTPTLGYEVDVPDQWTVVGGTFLTDPSPQFSIFVVAPAPATSTLPQHPCRDHTARVVGPTVSDLARGLRRQPVLDVTKPVPVNLDGYRGLYLEVRIPGKVDAGSCVDDWVSLFESGGPDGYAWQEDWASPGEAYVARWWILDVDGERVVVMPSCDTGCTEDDFDTLTQMAESISFTSEK